MDIYERKKAAEAARKGSDNVVWLLHMHLSCSRMHHMHICSNESGIVYCLQGLAWLRKLVIKLDRLLSGRLGFPCSCSRLIGCSGWLFVDAVQPVEKTAFQDEQDRRAELAEQRRVAEAERLRDAYNQLKFTAVNSGCALGRAACSTRGTSLSFTLFANCFWSELALARDIAGASARWRKAARERLFEQKRR